MLFFCRIGNACSTYVLWIFLCISEGLDEVMLGFVIDDMYINMNRFMEDIMDSSMIYT